MINSGTNICDEQGYSFQFMFLNFCKNSKLVRVFPPHLCVGYFENHKNKQRNLFTSQIIRFNFIACLYKNFQHLGQSLQHNRGLPPPLLPPQHQLLFSINPLSSQRLLRLCLQTKPGQLCLSQAQQSMNPFSNCFWRSPTYKFSYWVSFVM